MSMSTSLLFFFFFFFFNHVFSLSQDGLFLQQLKLGLSDPDARLADWNDRDDSPCGWPGVRCNSAGSVASLHLPSFSLAGPFPSPDLLCRLPALSSLSLADNLLSGPLPASIARCRNLTYLDLSLNLLVGELPSSLAALPALRYLDLFGNNFSGPIPASFAAFPRLEVLSLVNNLLNDTIPAFLSNVSTLRQLNLSYNPFAAGELPAELGKLRNLEILWLTKCNLVGRIPASLGDLKKLTDLDLSANNLMGPIPEALNGLSSVVQIELYNNSLSGHLPNGWSNLTSLKRFDASMNLLEGEIPSDLCELQLESLNLYSNRLTGVVPEAISKSPNLYELRLFENRLSGQLPSGLGRNSPLRWVDLSGNPLSGEIPPGICDKGKLEELLLIDNSLEGPIPESLGECRSLVRVRLRGNQLSGEVPEGLWGLPRMQLLELSWNSLSGEVSHLISGASNLSIFLISNNKFIGKIPPEIGSVGNLEKFVAAMNLFSGPIPATLSRLSELATLDLHGNELSGELPENINSCKKLSDLNLANNQLTGNIPNGIGSLPVLNYLDLSNNLLTGEIPIELQNLKLNRFNLSNNLLSGKLPPLYANQNYRLSFLNNPGLCGDLTGLCSPSGRTSEWHRGNAWLLATIFALAGLILVAGLACVYWRYRKFKKGKTGWSKTKWTLTSFHKLVFSEHDIFDSLDEDNVIGSGSSGKVYKAVLNNGEVVAVKKLWGASKDGNSDDFQHCDDGFEAEVETLGKIRHKNIVKLWCACTARDCKLLVYEYMPNGSLGDLLHGGKGGGLLDWPARLRIALDAAEGLSYLHHDCVPPIVHRDVKSNNILLDGEFRARVADFGVAKMVEAVGEGPKSMSVIAGSCGYIAPEYAYTLRVNEKSDIYSFGVVILELLTGRRAIDPEYGEKDLVKWVCFTLEQKGVENVLDPNIDACYNEEMCKVMKIGLMCTAPLPINRPAMQRVVKMLQEISPSSKMKPAKKDGRLSPYYYDDESDRGSVL